MPVNKKYTDVKLTGITGQSNGGFMVTATTNKRPDLFGAVVA